MGTVKAWSLRRLGLERRQLLCCSHQILLQPVRQFEGSSRYQNQREKHSPLELIVRLLLVCRHIPNLHFFAARLSLSTVEGGLLPGNLLFQSL